MNVFLLHEDPDEAAKGHCDKHVPKMCLEAVQIANSGLHNADLEQHAFYKEGYDNHSWCRFAGKSFDHFLFVVRRAQALGREFLKRYGSRHTSHLKLVQNWRYDNLRAIEQAMGRADSEQVYVDLPQAMLDKYKQDDPIDAYLAYYRGEKMRQDWFAFEKADPPEWLFEDVPVNRWF